MLKLSDNITLKSDKGNYMLFDNTSGDIFRLNEISYNILCLCDGQNSEMDIASKISDIFDAPAERISEDLSRLAGILLNEGFIENV